MLERKKLKAEHLQDALNTLDSTSNNSSDNTSDQTIAATTEDAPLNSKKSVEEHKKELFQYVMDEGEPDKFFETKPALEANDKFSNEYNIACDAKTIIKDTVLDARKNAKDPKSQNYNYLVIHEYNDESSLNGGKLLGGLDGYDSLNPIMYEEYKCGKV
jgi:hypothetical protein